MVATLGRPSTETSALADEPVLPCGFAVVHEKEDASENILAVNSPTVVSSHLLSRYPQLAAARVRNVPK